MSTTKDHGRIVFECDQCHETNESEPDESFETTWERLKEEGWTARKVGAGVGTGWYHFHDDKCLADWEHERQKYNEPIR